MLSLATETDRTLFFDFLPIEIGRDPGHEDPDPALHRARAGLLQRHPPHGAEGRRRGRASCATRRRRCSTPTSRAMRTCGRTSRPTRSTADEIPVVLQYNKRDLPNALPIEILNERMNPHNYPFYEAIAVKGVGVEDTLKAVTKLVFKALSVRYGDGAAAPSPPGRAPGPPRSMPAPVRPTPAPPLAVSTDDLLGELDLVMPEPEEVLAPRPPTGRRSSSTRTRPSGRSIRSRSRSRSRSLRRCARSLRRLPPRGPPRWPRRAPACRRSPPAPRSRHTARRTRSSPTGRGRRPAPRHLHARDARGRRRDGPRGGRRPRPPDARQTRHRITRRHNGTDPELQPERAGATEVEVPIDIEVAPGTTPDQSQPQAPAEPAPPLVEARMTLRRRVLAALRLPRGLSRPRGRPALASRPGRAPVPAARPGPRRERPRAWPCAGSASRVGSSS